MSEKTFFEENYEIIKNMFLRYGIKSVSMDDVASTLNISKRTLYEHFESKEILLSMVLDQFIKEDIKMQEEIAKIADPMDALYAFFGHAVEILNTLSESTIYDLKKFYSRLYRRLDDFRNKAILDNIINYLSKGQEQGYLRKDISINLQAELFLLVMTSILEFESNMNMERRVALFETFYKTQLKGIATEKGLQKINSYEN